MDTVNIGVLETSSGEWNEDGFCLVLAGDEQTVRLRVTDTETARELLAQLKWLQSWIDEHDHQYAAYIAASPEEREAVLLGVVAEHSDDEALRDAADIARKRAKGE